MPSDPHVVKEAESSSRRHRRATTTQRSARSDAGRVSAECSTTTAARLHEARATAFRTPRASYPPIWQSIQCESRVAMRNGGNCPADRYPAGSELTRPGGQLA